MVSNSEKHFYHHCDKTLQKVGLTDVSSKDLVNIVDGYKGKGYGQSTEEELGMAFISTFFIRLNTKVRGWLWAAVDTSAIYIYFIFNVITSSFLSPFLVPTFQNQTPY